MIAIIAARSMNNVIGKNGTIPWKIKGELDQFRDLTAGKTVIMGRRTYEDIGHPLPDRKTIVVSRTKQYEGEDLSTAPSLEAAIEMAGSEDVYIGGGHGLYKEAIPLADVMYITEVKIIVDDGDTFFPEFDADEFDVTVGETAGEDIEYTRMIYTRKKDRSRKMEFKEGNGWKACYDEEKGKYFGESGGIMSYHLYELTEDLYGLLNSKMTESDAWTIMDQGRHLFMSVDDRCGPPYTIVFDDECKELCPWAKFIGGGRVWSDELTDAAVEVFASEENNREQRRSKRKKREEKRKEEK